MQRLRGNVLCMYKCYGGDVAAGDRPKDGRRMINLVTKYRKLRQQVRHIHAGSLRQSQRLQDLQFNEYIVQGFRIPNERVRNNWSEWNNFDSRHSVGCPELIGITGQASPGLSRIPVE